MQCAQSKGLKHVPGPSNQRAEIRGEPFWILLPSIPFRLGGCEILVISSSHLRTAGRTIRHMTGNMQTCLHAPLLTAIPYL